MTGARRLSELAQSGVSLDELAAGLERLRVILPDVDRPLAQLEVLARGKRFLYRDATGLVEPSSGQRVFDFESPPPCPDDDEVATIPMRPAVEAASPGDSINRHECNRLME